jgi:hypothetical protein
LDDGKISYSSHKKLDLRGPFFLGGRKKGPQESERSDTFDFDLTKFSVGNIFARLATLPLLQDDGRVHRTKCSD